MQSTAVAELIVTNGVSGPFTTSWPVSVVTPAGHSQWITLDAPTSIDTAFTIYDPVAIESGDSTISVEMVGGETLQAFTRFSPDHLLTAIEQTAGFCGSLRAVGFRDQTFSAPFLAGIDLTDTVEIGTPIRDLLLNALTSPEGTPTFDTLQEFVDQASAALGLTFWQLNPRFDPVAEQLSFRFDVSDFALPTRDEAYPLDVTADTKSIVGSGNLHVAPVVDQLGYDISIDIGKYTAEIIGNVPLPADGVLTSDAEFTFTANGESLEIEVAADPTSTSRRGPAGGHSGGSRPGVRINQGEPCRRRGAVFHPVRSAVCDLGRRRASTIPRSPNSAWARKSTCPTRCCPAPANFRRTAG